MAVLLMALWGSSAIALAGFALYLAFLTFVVIRTGSTSGLRDVAIAIRAFGSVGGLGARMVPGPPGLHRRQVCGVRDGGLEGTDKT